MQKGKKAYHKAYINKPRVVARFGFGEICVLARKKSFLFLAEKCNRFRKRSAEESDSYLERLYKLTSGLKSNEYGSYHSYGSVSLWPTM